MEHHRDPYRTFLEPLERGHHLAVLAQLATQEHPSARWLWEWTRYQMAQTLLRSGHRCCAQVHLAELRARYPSDLGLELQWSHCETVPPTSRPSMESPRLPTGRVRIVVEPGVGDGEVFRRLLLWKPPPEVEVGLSGPCRFRRLFERRFQWLSGPADWAEQPALSLLHLPPCLPLPRLRVSPPQWSERLRVGLVWSDGQGRGTALNAFACLAQVPGLEFHALQKGPAAIQARWPPPGMQLQDWSRSLPDWAATAELLGQLDLLVTVDTAIASLALGLGRPCWILGSPPWSLRRGWSRLMDRVQKTLLAGKDFSSESPN